MMTKMALGVEVSTQHKKRQGQGSCQARGREGGRKQGVQRAEVTREPQKLCRFMPSPETTEAVSLEAMWQEQHPRASQDGKR